MFVCVCLYKCLCYHFSPHHRKEIPPEKDQREEASHEGVHHQTAAIWHLEDGERVLRVCTGAVPVCQGTCCERKGRRALPAGSELLLWENLPQKLRGPFVQARPCGWRRRRLPTAVWLGRTRRAAEPFNQLSSLHLCQATGRGVPAFVGLSPSR